MNEIYNAPKAALTGDSDVAKDIRVLQRFSTWYVIGLTIITLSLYIPYWLYTRAKKINTVSENPISQVLLFTMFSMFLASIFLALAEGFYASNANLAIVSAVINLASNILLIIVVFSIRNRLKPFAEQKALKVGPILTFFFQIFYLQYKINEIIDHSEISLEE